MQTKVTPEIRELHFNTFGYMVGDDAILEWYLKDKKKRESHKNSTKEREKNGN